MSVTIPDTAPAESLSAWYDDEPHMMPLATSHPASASKPRIGGYPFQEAPNTAPSARCPRRTCGRSKSATGISARVRRLLPRARLVR